MTPNEKSAARAFKTALTAALYQDKLIALETAQSVLLTKNNHDIPLIHALVQSGHLTNQTIIQCCKKHFTFPTFDLHDYDLTFLHHPLIKPEIMSRYQVIPLNNDTSYLKLAMADPTDQATLSALEFHTGLRIHPTLVSAADLYKIIHTHCRPAILYAQLEETLSKMSVTEEPSDTHEITDSQDEPVRQFTDRLLQEAIEKNASDIHIEPLEQSCRIRFRCDGLLYLITTIPQHLSIRVITRLKIMALMDISERRLPQDGRIKLDNNIDIRVSTCPTSHGEKLALRLLNMTNHHLELSSLGLTHPQHLLLLSRLAQPQGLILVTGPTGSGKTQTLYAALHHLNQIEKNIATVEDPVEIQLHGINQVSVNTRIDLTFSTLLRTLLRQDPDVLMIGEIRDTETANMSLQAAQTGHLVLSTLHANTAIDSILRLQSMGIQSPHLQSALSLIIAQRLVRRLCEHCKIRNKFGSAGDYIPIGCPQCTQGYKGRVGIFECLPISETTFDLATMKKEMGMLLREAGLEKVKGGITSLTELERVLGHELS